MDGSKPDNIVACLTECQNLYKDRSLLQKDVVEFFCNRCRNDGCARAGHGEMTWVRRMATQVDRFFNTEVADPNLPQYKEFVDREFQDMTQHAMRLIVSSQRGDWEVPEMPQVMAPSRFMAGDKEIEASPEDLQKALGAMPPSPEEFLGVDTSGDGEDAPFGSADMVDIDTEPLYPDFVGDLSEMEPPPSQGPSIRAKVSAVEANQKAVKAGNVERRSGIMLGGPPPEAEAKREPEGDPWAVPDHYKPGAKKVQIGSTYTFGGGTKEKK